MATETGRPGAGDSQLALPQLSLAALFITALVTAQVTASKVVEIGSPISLPITGESITVPAAVFAYAITFFASDCYAELYGKRAAQYLVNIAFTMNFVLLGLVWLAIAAPIYEFSPVAQGPFADTLGASTGIVVGSLLAYLVSQNWDVLVFHRLREATGGKSLWLRNIASTATSQLIDTVIFITVAFLLFQGFSPQEAAGLIIGQYVFKLLLAGLDTPFVYLAVRLIGRSEPTTYGATADD